MPWLMIAVPAIGRSLRSRHSPGEAACWRTPSGSTADRSEGLSGTIDGLYPGGGLRFPIWSHSLSDAAQRVLLVGEPCSHSAVPGAARQSRRLAGHER